MPCYTWIVSRVFLPAVFFDTPIISGATSNSACVLILFGNRTDAPVSLKIILRDVYTLSMSKRSILLPN